MTHYVDDPVLRYALHNAVDEICFTLGRVSPHPLDGSMIESILALLQLSLKPSAASGVQDTKWLIVHAYLWTSWQRCLMMEMLKKMASQLKGYDYETNSHLSRRRIQSIPQIGKVLSQQQNNQLYLTPYLCGWSMRSLRNDRGKSVDGF